MQEAEGQQRGGGRSSGYSTSPIACVAWLIPPYKSAHISFDAPIIQPSSNKPCPILRTTCFYSTVHYEQVVLLIFPPSNGCYTVNTIIFVFFYHAKCPKSNERITPVISCVLRLFLCCGHLLFQSEMHNLIYCLLAEWLRCSFTDANVVQPCKASSYRRATFYLF